LLLTLRPMPIYVSTISRRRLVLSNGSSSACETIR
jgi:hypothetical protein